MIASNIWEEILSRVQAKVNRHSFYTWFKPTAFVADDGSTVTVRVPNALFKDWITKHYSGVIAEALDEVRSDGSTGEFRRERHARGRSSRRLRSPETREPKAANQETSAFTAEDSLPPVMPTSSAGLNPRYTFDTFIVGIVESVRPCGLPGGRRSAVALVQPAVHLRRSGSRQDALDACDWPLRAAARSLTWCSPTSRPSDS